MGDEDFFALVARLQSVGRMESQRAPGPILGGDLTQQTKKKQPIQEAEAPEKAVPNHANFNFDNMEDDMDVPLSLDDSTENAVLHPIQNSFLEHKVTVDEIALTRESPILTAISDSSNSSSMTTQSSEAPSTNTSRKSTGGDKKIRSEDTGHAQSKPASRPKARAVRKRRKSKTDSNPFPEEEVTDERHVKGLYQNYENFRLHVLEQTQAQFLEQKQADEVQLKREEQDLMESMDSLAKILQTPFEDSANVLLPSMRRHSMEENEGNTRASNCEGYSWYVGKKNRKEGEGLLKDWPAGTFVVREGRSSKVVTLKFPASETKNYFHVRIQYRKLQFFIADAEFFSSIPELVMFYLDNPAHFFKGMTREEREKQVLIPYHHVPKREFEDADMIKTSEA